MTTGWQKRFADFMLDIDGSGNVLHVTPLERQEEKKKIRRELRLPEEPRGRGIAIKPAFLCDNAGYLFGADPKRGEAKFAAAAQLHADVLKDVDTPAANAIKRYFENAPQPPEELSEQKNNCVFAVNGLFAQDDPQIANAWNAYKPANMSGETVRCLVSGAPDSLARLHAKISLRGVSMGAQPLVSVNAESFASYGKTKDHPAAQIGENAAFAYATALNDLLKAENHRMSIGDDTFVYWVENGGEAEAEAFSWFVTPKPDEEAALATIMRRVMVGKAVETLDFEKRFYILCLSPNAARISVRFFHTDAFGAILQNLARHHKRLEIIRPAYDDKEYLSLYALLSATVNPKSRDKNPAPLLGGAVLRDIITGADYPWTLYNAVLLRIKAGDEISRAKAAILKAFLIKNHKEEISVALDKENNEPAYALGRLFSVLEQVQEAANGSSNVRERYFTSACATPGAAFTPLLRLSVHHIAKLEDGLKVHYEKLKTELLSKLDAETAFPATFDMRQQGLFILGYYHQQQDRYTKKEDK
jgi:CRISPR-associated protein Csd1